MKSVEIRGLWWLPAEPENQVAGILKYSPSDGAHLDLIGAFGGIQSFVTLNHPAVIHGIGDKKAVTLVDCLNTASQLQLPGIHTQSYRAHQVVLGAHLAHPDDEDFFGLDVDFTYLRDWFPISGWTAQMTVTQSSQLQTYSLTYTNPAPSPRAQTLVGELAPTVTFTTGALLDREPRPVERTRVRVWRAERASLGELLTDTVAPLQDLLTFATGHPNAVEELRFYTAEQRGPHEVLYQPSTVMPGRSRRLEPRDILLSFGDFESIGGTDGWTRWFDVHAQFRKAFRLFSAVRHSVGLFIDLRFVSLTNACEAFHRVAHPSPPMAPRDHEKRVQSILAAAPNEHRSWLADRLAYSNEPSLRQRLKKLGARLGGLRTRVLPARAISRIVDTRNYFAHRTAELEKKAAEGEELHDLNLRLQCLLEANFLHELGFRASDLQAHLARSRALARLP